MRPGNLRFRVVPHDQRAFVRREVMPVILQNSREHGEQSIGAVARHHIDLSFRKRLVEQPEIHGLRGAVHL